MRRRGAMVGASYTGRKKMTQFNIILHIKRFFK
jgi:hypothetical protein